MATPPDHEARYSQRDAHLEYLDGQRLTDHDVLTRPAVPSATADAAGLVPRSPTRTRLVITPAMCSASGPCLRSTTRRARTGSGAPPRRCGHRGTRKDAGDAHVPHAPFAATRAISIAASPPAVCLRHSPSTADASATVFLAHLSPVFGQRGAASRLAVHAHAPGTPGALPVPRYTYPCRDRRASGWRPRR